MSGTTSPTRHSHATRGRLHCVVLMKSQVPLELAGVERCGSEFAAGGHPGFSGVRCPLSTTVDPEEGGGGGGSCTGGGNRP